MALLWFLQIGISQAQIYHVTDLGTLGGSQGSVAYGLNNSGQVVGSSYLSGNTKNYAFLYGNGTMTNLGPLPLPPGFGIALNSSAAGINDSGLIVGTSDYISSSRHAFYVTGGAMVDLGVDLGGTSSATAVNASGHVVGDMGTASGQHAYVYDISSDTLTDIGALLGPPGLSVSVATGINTLGQVVGNNVSLLFNAPHAFRFSGGIATDLGTLTGGHYSTATGINASGQVVGQADTATSSIDAYLYTNGVMTDLGAGFSNFGSIANGINSSGTVVGESYSTSNHDLNGHAFVYSGGVMTDLNSALEPNSNWTLLSANAINDKGQIVGLGINILGRTDAFLLTPAIPGDVNHDGTVNGLDISLIAGNWLSTGAPGIPGDADFNGVVNGLDISLVAGHWLESNGTGDGTGAAASVPEPSTLTLAALGIAATLAYRCRLTKCKR